MVGSDRKRGEKVQLSGISAGQWRLLGGFWGFWKLVKLFTPKCSTTRAQQLLAVCLFHFLKAKCSWEACPQTPLSTVLFRLQQILCLRNYSTFVQELSLLVM